MYNRYVRVLGFRYLDLLISIILKNNLGINIEFKVFLFLNKDIKNKIIIYY